MYSFKSTVRYSECDATSRLTMPALINYLQDCSTFHTESIGHGVTYLAEHHFAWFITNWQIFVDRMPRYCEPIEISTWCHGNKATNMHRNFRITGEGGETLVRADSLWVVFDTERQRATRVPESELIYITGEEPIDLPPIERKIRLAGEGVAQNAIEIAEHHLDTNHHVNNAQYVGMADSLVHATEEGFEPARLYVQYKRAAQLGDAIVPRVYTEEQGYAVDLADEAGESYAIVRMEHA